MLYKQVIRCALCISYDCAATQQARCKATSLISCSLIQHESSTPPLKTPFLCSLTNFSVHLHLVLPFLLTPSAPFRPLPLPTIQLLLLLRLHPHPSGAVPQAFPFCLSFASCPPQQQSPAGLGAQKHLLCSSPTSGLGISPIQP